MFRDMRRKRQALPPEQCAAILRRGTSGVLALAGDAGYPYAVPLSYVYTDGKLYFHCAKAGHKLDAIQREPRASFCVIDQDEIVPEEYTTYFRSVIAFGRIRILADDAQKRSAIDALAQCACGRPEARNRPRIGATVYAGNGDRPSHGKRSHRAGPAAARNEISSK